MATSYGDSSESSLTDNQLQSQNIYKGETRDLPINDHVTITEDEDVVTCLSPQVYNLVTKRDHMIQSLDFLDDQFTIDIAVLRQHFGADAVQQLDIVGGARKLHSLAIAVHNKVSSFTAEQFTSIYHHYLIWSGQPMVFEDCYRQLVANEIAALHICYLLGAATLERALGNLYLTLSNARLCPSLLRDLLMAVELHQCLGAEVMYCLQCLIGPPSGLNLRNLIWHGFPYPGEIPIEFGHLLLVLVATIGRILVQSKGEGLIHREYLTITTHDDVIKEYYDVISTEMSKDDLIGLIDKSHLVLPQKRPLWHKAITEYYNGQYHICTALLLSEMEHAVRRMFVSVNNCPHRLLTAESTHLYTTFDEHGKVQCLLKTLLAQVVHPLKYFHGVIVLYTYQYNQLLKRSTHLSLVQMMVRLLEDGSSNALVEELGIPYMEMLLDLLIHPEGPRLRDRISHGEVNVYHLSATMAAHVIMVAMALCDHYCTSSTQWSDKMSNYHSLFHPLAILRRELLALINALHPLYDVYHVDLPRNVAVQEAIKCVGDSERGVALVLQKQLVKGGATTDSINSDSIDLHMIQLVIQEKWFHLVKTLFVSRDTMETSGILRRCIQHCHTGILQVKAMLTLRQEQLEKKILRSRQRTNYELLQESSVVYADVSRLLVGVVMIEVTRSHHHDHQKIVKSLKKILQFTENFGSLTSPSKNRWDVVNSLCVDLANKIATLPLLIT